MAIYDANALIVQTPDLCDGLPHIDGTTVTVDKIYEAYFILGLSAEQIMVRFQIQPVQAFAALAFVHQFEPEVKGLYERLRRRCR
ncbi:DUF433 domain-containing protein [Aggregatilineales bacterium SYSU G02658]